MQKTLTVLTAISHFERVCFERHFKPRNLIHRKQIEFKRRVNNNGKEISNILLFQVKNDFLSLPVSERYKEKFFILA